MNAEDLKSVQAPLKDRYRVMHQTLAHPTAMAVSRKPVAA